MDQALMLRIRERAYQIWAASGGNAEDNWVRAETEILNLSAPEAPHYTPRKKQFRGRGTQKKPPTVVS